jgi:hypothetical protein
VTAAVLADPVGPIEAAGGEAAVEPWVIDPYSPDANAETFNIAGWLATFDPLLLSIPEGRRISTALDPMLFAYVYMRKHLKDALGRISFADAHFLWARLARRWIGPARGQREDRRALVAPRACGKSTWFFLILPLWGGVHGHIRFAAAFADSGSQAELHLATFKRELTENALLRVDFKDFCEPARRHTGRTVADNQNMIYTRTQFTFVAKGIDSTSLGMKVGEQRPDLLIFDDIEPPESNYSPFQRDKRLATVQNAILPLNELARVVIVGTVTMPGSIVHELVRHSKGEDVEDWVDDERFKTYHTRPIIQREDGTERSVWPMKWTLPYLKSIQHTRGYKLNFDNDPKGRQGNFWNVEDIRYGLPAGVTKLFIIVDPPVTQKTTSDDAGIAVVGYIPPTMTAKLSRVDMATHPREFLAETLLEHEVADTARGARLARVVVLEAFGVKATGANLKKRVLDVLGRWPRVQAVVLENNQGGDLWLEVFNDLPVKFVTFGSHEKKETRFARALDFYQKRRVLHAQPFRDLEDQMTAFPKVAHDDICDAVCAGVLRLLMPRPVRKNSTIPQR